MYVFADVDAYLNLITGAENYTSLTTTERQKLVFTAYELLSLTYSEPLLSTKVVAYQALYMADAMADEAEAATTEETAVLQTIRKAGAKSYTLDDVSVTFDSAASTTFGISPLVTTLLEAVKPGAFIGRLI